MLAALRLTRCRAPYLGAVYRCRDQAASGAMRIGTLSGRILKSLVDPPNAMPATFAQRDAIVALPGLDFAPSGWLCGNRQHCTGEQAVYFGKASD